MLGQRFTIWWPPRLSDGASRRFFPPSEDRTRGGRWQDDGTDRTAKDGSEFPVDLSLAAVQKGQEWHAVALVRDITDRKRRRRRCGKSGRLSERRGKRAGGHLCGGPGLLPVPESRGPQLFGATSDSELLNQPVLEHVHPDSRAYVTQAIQQVEKLGAPYPVGAEVSQARRDGPRHRGVRRTSSTRARKEVWFSFVMSANGHGGRGVASERISSVRIAEHCRVGSWEATLQSGATTWTPEAFRLFGVSPGYFCPVRGDVRKFDSPGRSAGHASLDGRLSGGAGTARPEFRVPLQDGSVRYINGRGHLVRDAEHKPVRMVGVVQDITDFRRSEELLLLRTEELKRSNTELEQFRLRGLARPPGAIADGFQLHAASGAPLPG